MASLEFLAIILTGLGLIVSLTYYAMALRNQNQTRQAQLLMQIHSTLHTQENWRSYLESQYQADFKDYQDFPARACTR